MKKRVLIMLMLVCLPLLAMAQSAGDDLYFIPKKKKAQKQEVKTVVPVKQQANVYAAPGSTVVVKDFQGRTRDVDEYNRRYTARDNRFSMQNDTLYIEEKPLNERGEWVNGFEGSQSDYEYAMRIVRFRNPRYAIPVSSPLYWDVVYTLPSWEWNVYDDGFYAYAFPTATNRLWWDWRWNSWGPGWSFSWGWSSPWYYSSWCGPSYYWGSRWGWYDHFHYHHHYFPHYGWGGGHWGGHHHWTRPDWYNDRRGNPARYRASLASHRGDRYSSSNGLQTDRRAYRSSQRGTGNSRVAGRVVRSSRVASQRTSVRPSRGNVYRGETVGGTLQSDRRRPSSAYTRPNLSGRGETNYTRPSSTRSSVRNMQGTYRRGQAVERSSNYSRNNRSSFNSNRSSYNSNRSSYGSSRSSSGSFSSGSSHSRSSYSTGGGGGRSSGGGGARRR